MTFAVLSGLTTAEGGPDWISLITVTAGAILLVTGAYNLFHHGTA
jgi:hypothetical protein